MERLNTLAGQHEIGDAAIEVLHLAYAEHLEDNVPHRHTYFEVCSVGAYGKGVFTAQGEKYSLAPGDLFIARPGVVHQIQNTSHRLMELYWVSFAWKKASANASSERSMEQASSLLRAFSESPLLVIRDLRTYALWKAMREVASTAPLVGQELQLRHLLGTLLLSIAQSGAGSAAPKEYFALARSNYPAQTAQLAVRYIHDNLHRRLFVDEVAQHVHLSVRHLARLIQSYTGVAPAEYIERARVDRARHLLRTSTLAIKEVARESGYADVHHFTRVFTRCCGLPPGEYRRQGAPALPHLDVPNIQNPGKLV